MTESYLHQINLSQRNRYCCDAPLNLFRILACAVLAMVAVVVAAVLLAAVARGLLMALQIGVVGAVVCSAAVYAAIDFGKCWSTRLAVCLSLIISVVFFFAYFQFALSLSLGPGSLTQFKILPAYVVHRVETDVAQVHNGGLHSWIILSESIVTPFNPAAPTALFSGSQTWLRWLHFAVEWLAIIIAPIVYALRASRRAFCGNCDSWMKAKTAYIQHSQLKNFVEAIASNSPERLAETKFVPPFGTLPELTIEYCSTVECPAYLSLRMAEVGKQNGRKWIIDGLENFLQLELTQAEKIALLAFMEKPATRASSSRTAGITLIEESFQEPPRGSPLGPLSQTAGIGLAFGECIAGLGGFIGALFILASTGTGGSLRPTAASGWILVYGGIAALLILFVACIYDLIRNDVTSRYLRRRCRAYIKQRESLFVDPDDDYAMFIDITPRQFWYSLNLLEPGDIGFGKIDVERRAFLFEGVRTRFCVPAEAICGCRVETVQHHNVHYTIVQYAVILNATTENGICEKPLFPKLGGVFANKKRANAAGKLLENLQRLQFVAVRETEAGTSR